MSTPMGQMPMDEAEPMMDERAEQSGQMLSEQDEQDIDIIIALALEMIEGNPDGEQVLQKILSSAAPEKQLAMFFTQLIEVLMTDPSIVELQVNPAVIMAQGGVVDQLTEELSDLVGQDITPIVEAAKPIIMQNVQKRAAQFAQEGQGSPPEQAPQQQAPRPLMTGV